MRQCMLLFVLTGALFAQQSGPMAVKPSGPVSAEITEHNLPISQSDLYCAGFVGKTLPRDRFVAGGLGTPQQARYVDRDFIYLRGGGYQPGTRVAIVREQRDPNRFAPFEGTEKLLKQTGQIYGEIGYATIVENRGKDIAVAQVEFSCESIVPGDLVAPFVEKAPVTVRQRSIMDQFPASPALSGRIIAARDFEQFFGVGRKVYVNLGADKGIRPGDYFRVVRAYTHDQFDQASSAEFNARISEDTQSNPPRIPNKKLGDLPRHVVGEAVVLSTQPGSATAMVTFAIEEIHVGDTVEREETR